MKPHIYLSIVLALGCTMLFLWTIDVNAMSVSAYDQIEACATLGDNNTYESALINTDNNEVIRFTSPYSIYLPLIQQYRPPEQLCAIAPTLISPTNGSVLNTLIPFLEYMRGTDPVSYTRVTIADNIDFIDPTGSYRSYGEGIGPRQLMLFDNLQPSTLYYWRVQDYCGSTVSPFSPVYTFTTGSNGIILPAPTLVSPISGTLGVTQEVTVTWNSVDGATGYQLTTSEAGYEGGIIYITPGTSELISNQDPNIVYQWYVRAYNDYAYGEPSETWLYTTGSFVALEETNKGTSRTESLQRVLLR